MIRLQKVSREDYEPLSLSEVKLHLKVDADADDALISNLIQGARELLEDACSITLIKSTYRIYLDGFQQMIYLPRAPLISVDSVKYLDTDGSEQTLAASRYSIDAVSKPGRIRINDIPGTDADALNAVWVEYQAGYLDSSVEADLQAAVPMVARQAMLLIIGYWYENREDFYTDKYQAPRAARYLMARLKVQDFYSYG